METVERKCVNVNVNVNLGNNLIDNIDVSRKQGKGREVFVSRERRPRTRPVTRNAFNPAVCGDLERVFVYGPVSLTD